MTTKRTLSCPLLLACATALAILSLFVPGMTQTLPLVISVPAGYAPIVLGGLSMLLCLAARQRTRHKRLVIAYAVLLAPFAFCYPAWMMFLIAVMYLHLPVKFNGPMP